MEKELKKKSNKFKFTSVNHLLVLILIKIFIILLS